MLLLCDDIFHKKVAPYLASSQSSTADVNVRELEPDNGLIIVKCRAVIGFEKVKLTL